MLGYMRPEIPELKVKDYHLFRSYYCGVCHGIKDCGGRACCLALSYDATLLALVDSLYGGESQAERRRCLANPLRREMVQKSVGVDFAADVNLLYAHLKCVDDVADEGTMKSRLAERFLRKAARKAAQRHPALYETSAKELKELAQLEKEGCDQADLPANTSGRMLGEAFAALPQATPRDGEALRWLGLHIGRFVYFCDTLEDAPEDDQKGNYNVFLRAYGSVENMQAAREEVEMLLFHSIAEADKALMLLPERPVKELVRNVTVEHAGRLAVALLNGESSRDQEQRMSLALG